MSQEIKKSSFDDEPVEHLDAHAGIIQKPQHTGNPASNRVPYRKWIPAKQAALIFCASASDGCASDTRVAQKWALTIGALACSVHPFGLYSPTMLSTV